MISLGTQFIIVFNTTISSMQVPVEDLDDPHILGQMPRRGDQYM